MQPVTSTHLSSALTLRDLHDDVTCTTRIHASTSLEVRLGNHSLTGFQVKQATRYRRVSRADLPPSIL
jgi:hypothetical protein